MMEHQPVPPRDSILVSIVVPTYREAENLDPLVRRIGAAMETVQVPYEVIVVDDDSRDGSDERVRELANDGFPVRMVIRTGERGLSSAVVRGFEEGRGEFLICMDADLSHPPEALPNLLQALDGGGADFVIGSRYVAGGATDENWGVFRWLNSKVATLLARPFTSARDPMAGFFGLPAAVYRRAEALNPIGYKIGLELLVKCRCQAVVEVPIHFADRQFGQSKLNLREQLNYIRHLKRLADFKFGGFAQLAQFCMVGASGVVVDLVSFAVLLQLALPSKVARAVAIGVAMTWNFLLNRRVTFSHTRDAGILGQYARFVISSTAGALISWTVFVVLSEWVTFFGRHLMVAAFLGIVGGTASNFWLSRHWVFRAKPAEMESSGAAAPARRRAADPPL